MISLLTIGIWSAIFYIIFSNVDYNTDPVDDYVEIKVYKDSIKLLDKEKNEEINAVRTADVDSVYNIFKKLCNE